MSFSSEMISVAKEILTELGMSVTVSRRNYSGFNTATLKPNPASPSSWAALAAYFDPSNSNMSGYEKTLVGDDIKGGKWLYIQSDTALKVGDTITTPGGKDVLINALSELGADDTVVYYRVMGSRTE